MRTVVQSGGFRVDIRAMPTTDKTKQELVECVCRRLRGTETNAGVQEQERGLRDLAQPYGVLLWHRCRCNLKLPYGGAISC